MTDIHSCSYFCERPECVKAQRDELRERLAQPEHITDGSPCWCNPDVIEEDGGKVIVHNYDDNWQQYAKPGETAQQCIERHRGEQDALLELLKQSRHEQGGKTGWPAGMLQDDSRELSKALASKPDARLHAREAAEAARQEQEPVWDASAPLVMTPHPEFKKAQKLYHTVLTSGEDEQYAIIGLYASEQPVDTQEWSDALKAYNSRLEAEHRAIYVRHGGRLGYGHIPAAHAEYIAYMQSTHPLQAFLVKHHMQKLDFKEIWTWGQP